MSQWLSRAYSFVQSAAGRYLLISLVTTPIGLYAFGYLAAGAKTAFLSIPTGATSLDQEYISLSMSFCINVLASPPALLILALIAVYSVFRERRPDTDAGAATPVAPRQRVVVILVSATVYFLLIFQTLPYHGMLFNDWSSTPQPRLNQIIYVHWEISSLFLLAVLCWLGWQFHLLLSVAKQIRLPALIALALIMTSQAVLYPWLFGLTELATKKVTPIQVKTDDWTSGDEDEHWLVWNGRQEIALMSVRADTGKRIISVINRDQLHRLDVVDKPRSLFALVFDQPDSRKNTQAVKSAGTPSAPPPG